MNKDTARAYEWALNQNYQSVAARYAKTLAEHIKSAGTMDNPIVIEIKTPWTACCLMQCDLCPVDHDYPACSGKLFDLIRERGMIVKVKEG